MAQNRRISVSNGIQEGVLSLYRGWLPSVIGVVPYVGLNFAVYETLKDVAIKQYKCSTDQDLSSTYRLAAGGVAGTVGQTIAYPFDVVRRRLQVLFFPESPLPKLCAASKEECHKTDEEDLPE
jgi:hypothetical protein